MSDHDEIELRLGDLELHLAPTLGGAITAFRHAGFDLLRPWDGVNNVRHAGCFVLAPYSNRIGGGRFVWAGTEHRLARNSPDHDLPIHGVAWKRGWTVQALTSDSITLECRHRPDGTEGEWPFAFTLRHRLQLTEQGLELALTLENDAPDAAPAGLGWHPYFARHAGIELQFEAGRVWLSDEHQLPSRAVPVPDLWNFTASKPVVEPRLDHCFDGWLGEAELHWPAAGRTLRLQASEGVSRLVVFTPPVERGFIAVEPVTHVNNALNMDHPETHGMRVLRPGKAWTVGLRMVVESV